MIIMIFDFLEGRMIILVFIIYLFSYKIYIFSIYLFVLEEK